MSVAGDGWGLNREQLKVLMTQRRGDGVAAISDHGGLDQVASQLKTNLKDGLNSTPKDLARRRSYYGANVLQTKNPLKSFAVVFLESCVYSLKDKLLRFFVLTAVLSIILGLAIEQRKVNVS